MSKHNLKSSCLDEDDPLFRVTEFLCFNCDTERRKQAFPSALALIEHLKFKHQPGEKEVIKNMQKRYHWIKNPYSNLRENDEKSKEPTFLSPTQKLITGIKNSSGQVSRFFVLIKSQNKYSNPLLHKHNKNGVTLSKDNIP